MTGLDDAVVADNEEVLPKDEQVQEQEEQVVLEEDKPKKKKATKIKLKYDTVVGDIQLSKGTHEVTKPQLNKLRKANIDLKLV